MSSKKPQPDFAPYVLRGEAIQAVQISALWFADGAPQLPNTVKIKRALRRVAIGLGETEVSAGHGDWLILTAEGAPVLMSDRDFRMLFQPAPESLTSPDREGGVNPRPLGERVAAQQPGDGSPLPDSPLTTRDLAPSPEATS